MGGNVFHSKAYLSRIRNVKAGLLSRTRIIMALEKEASTIVEIADRSRLTYGCTLHHLRAMSRERIVGRSGKNRGSTWFLTEFGQQRLE
ncbi:MAG: hypothetical protein V1857_02015 [archaeon]